MGCGVGDPPNAKTICKDLKNPYHATAEMLFRSCGPAAITGQFLPPPWVSTGRHFLYFLHLKTVFCLGFSYFLLCGSNSNFFVQFSIL
jgi:hypothetical protein